MGRRRRRGADPGERAKRELRRKKKGNRKSSRKEALRIRFKAQEYAARNRALARLGFDSYSSYLNSELWGSIRRKKLREFPRCYGCGVAAQQCHHSEYNILTLAGVYTSGIFTVCVDCHRGCEFTPRGRKLSPSMATKRLKKIRAETLK